MTTTSRATPRSRRPALLRAAVLAVLGVVLVAGTAVASAAPSGRVAAAPTSVGTLPPLPPGASDLAAVVAGSASDARAKVAFRLPVQIQRVYASARPPIIKGGTLTTFNDAYVVTDPGPNPSFGVFPDTDTTVFAFGALPVAAKIHLTQTSDKKGTLEPIEVVNVALSSFPFSSDTTVTATVLVRLSDVYVDGVFLDVGPDCAGSVPVVLKLTGHDDGGHHLPTDYNPFLGGPLAGTFDLPTFSGCGAGGQDLDPLLNGTVSGPDNAIRLNQGVLGEFTTDSPNDCQVSGTPKACPTPKPPPLPIPGR